MFIKKIRFKNGYKRFKDLTIDLGENPSRIVALVGPNGCGKSSVFDGMMFVQNAHESIGQFGQKDYKFHSMNGDAGYDWQNVEIDFDYGNFQLVIDNKRKTGKQKTIFSYRNPYRYNSNLNVTSLQRVSDIKDNRVGASSSVDLDDKVIDNYQRLYSYITDYYKKEDITYSEAKNIIMGDLNKVLESCLSLEIVDEGDIVAGNGALFFKKPDQEKQFSFNVLSSGEKEIVDMLLDIFLKRSEYNDTIYLIDEPELHLNTSIQKSLLLEIEKMIPENCQIWIATHSIGFINVLQKELKDISSIIFFEGEYATKTKTLRPMKKTRSNWQKVFSTALDDMIGLISPRTIIYCEGENKSDKQGKEKGLDANIYNIIFEAKYPDYFFISSGGGNELTRYSSIALDVLKKAFLDVDILILKDRGGKKRIKSDSERKKILSEDQNKRILLRREIENYVFDPEILKLYKSDLEITDIFEKDFDYKKEYLKSKHGIIKQKLNFKGTIKDLKINLAELITSKTEVYKELEKVIF